VDEGENLGYYIKEKSLEEGKKAKKAHQSSILKHRGLAGSICRGDRIKM